MHRAIDLLHSLVHQRACDFSRFYGGIKLGAGGLVRAYGGAARDCLRAAPKRQMTPQVQLRLQVGGAAGAAGGSGAGGLRFVSSRADQAVVQLSLSVLHVPLPHLTHGCGASACVALNPVAPAGAI